MAITYNTIEEALQDLRNGKCILVTDDPDRENEGDLICAGQFATTENVNLMASAAKGLICMPMSHDNIVRLGLTQMVSHNTDNHETAFTVSIDHIDTTTGISAVERGLTARMAADPAAHPGDFRRPGHMFPLEANARRVLERNGHTEATVDLLRLAGLTQVGLCCEIMDDDGTMMRGKSWRTLQNSTVCPLSPSGNSSTTAAITTTSWKKWHGQNCPPSTGISRCSVSATLSTATNTLPWSWAMCRTASRYCAGYTPSV